MDPKMEEAIRQRAYEIWEQEGRPEGQDLTHWLRARTEILDRELAAGTSLSDGGINGEPPGARGRYIPTTTPEARGETSFASGEKKHMP